MEKEEILQKFKPDRLAYWPNYFISVLVLVSAYWFGVLSIVVGLVLLIVTEVSRMTQHFYITQTGVCREYRFIARNRTFAHYDKIQNIEMSQSLAERILGIGTIEVATAGNDPHESEVVFFGIKNPYGIEQVIRERMNAHLPEARHP